MFISYREAFIGKKHLDRYKPKSEWVSINDPEKGWTEEFAAEQGIGKKEHCHFSGYKQMFVLQYEHKYIYWHKTTSLGPSSYYFFANKHLNKLFLVATGSSIIHDDASMDKIYEFIDGENGLDSQINLTEILGEE